MKNEHYYVLPDGNRIEVPCPVAWSTLIILIKELNKLT